MDQNLETITLGGGCFWCTEAVFERVKGVESVQSGYANGHGGRPSYEEVCTGRSGYSEVVRIRFDPKQVTLDELLQIFFVVHDPTTINRQGNDVGPQYRSGIYCEEQSQVEFADNFVARLQASGAYDQPIVTEVLLLENYWPAEDYHQHYFENNPGQGYCAFVVAPKVEKFKHTFARLQA